MLWIDKLLAYSSWFKYKIFDEIFIDSDDVVTNLPTHLQTPEKYMDNG
jgi:hypothetical protein